MSDFYGQWLNKDESDINIGASKEKYLARIAVFDSLAKKTVDDLVSSYPDLNGKIFICHQNIDIALGRYFNDIQRYKFLHKITTVHPAKMIAHTIKWLHLNPVLFGSIERIDFSKLSKKSKIAILNINFAFISQCVEYMFSEFNQNVSDSRFDNILYNLQYHLKTGLYQERMASLWFEELIKG